MLTGASSAARTARAIATAPGVVRLLPVDYSTSSGGVVAAVAALFFTVIFVMLALSQAHDGTEGLTDELD